MSTFKTSFNMLFTLGAVIIIVGLMLQWFPESTIAGIERRLAESGLSTEKRNELQGALLSWELWQLAVFNPVSTVLLASGIIITIYAILSAIFSLAERYIKTQEK